MAPSKKFTLVVTGPKDVLQNPIRITTSGNNTFRHFLKRRVASRKLVGLRVTRTSGGNAKDAVELDMKVKKFVERKYTKELSVYRVRLIRPCLQTSKGRGGVEPEVITLDDGDDEVFGGSVSEDEDGGVGGIISALKTEDPVVVVGDANTENRGEDAGASGQRGDGEQEQTVHGVGVGTPASAPDPAVGIKQEVKEEMSIKTELNELPEPPESTVADLRARGIPIDNLEAQVRTKIKNFSNPFLLILREEFRELREDGYKWQSIVGKAPRCAYLMDEMFK